MKTIIKTALILGLANFAFFANAQSVPSVGGNVAGRTVTPGIAPAVVDFVTVGAIMPYKSALSNEAIDQWITNVTAAFAPDTIPSTLIPSFVSQWTVTPEGGTTVNVGDPNLDQIILTWDVTPGRFTVGITTEVQIGGTTNVVECATSASQKAVYVLPAPHALRSDTDHGHAQVLNCNVEDHNVRFWVRGIGQRSIRYNITRRPLTGSIDVDENLVLSSAAADARTDESWFAEAPDGSMTWTIANNAYTTDTEQWVSDILVENLEVGWVYTVEITGVSDQISRKSGVGPLGDGYVPPATRLFSSFAVIPAPGAANIQHVSNIPSGL